MLLQQLTVNVPSCKSEVWMSLKSLFLQELDVEHNKMQSLQILSCATSPSLYPTHLFV